MLRSKFIVPALSALCLLGSQAVLPAAFASPARTHAPLHAYAGVKTVKLRLTNNSGEVMKIQAGEAPITVEPGQTVKLNVAVGTKIVNLDATKSHAAGEVLTQVSTALDGATIKVS